MAFIWYTAYDIFNKKSQHWFRQWFGAYNHVASVLWRNMSSPEATALTSSGASCINQEIICLDKTRFEKARQNSLPHVYCSLGIVICKRLTNDGFKTHDICKEFFFYQKSINQVQRWYVSMTSGAIRQHVFTPEHLIHCFSYAYGIIQKQNQKAHTCLGQLHLVNL